jgi:hypothetical protein
MVSEAASELPEVLEVLVWLVHVNLPEVLREALNRPSMPTPEV